MFNSFSLYELSEAEMTSLGLIDEYGDLTIAPEDLDILLTGRRTGMMSLHNLSSDGMQIAQMDAKLSLYRDSEGQAIIRVHPVYHKPQIPFAWDDSGAQALIEGKQLHSRYMLGAKTNQNEPVEAHEYILEYDTETREFLSYEPREVLVPDRINGFELSPAQKKDFSRGIPLMLPDGTNLVYKATESNGLLANRWSLILSNDTEDGRTYEMLEGIRRLGTSRIAGQSLAFQQEYAAMNAEIEATFHEIISLSRKRVR